ncbi:MAG: hypothetical protein V2A76_15410, partial [Planctomycetota bacterium]
MNPHSNRPLVRRTMPGRCHLLGAALALSLLPGFKAHAADGEPIRMLRDFAVSPDGSLLAFSWVGDLWIAPVSGGAARQLTRDEGTEESPCFSPDGSEIAFSSNRTGPSLLYVVPVLGGTPRQVSHHSEGGTPLEYHPDGSRLLVSGNRDHFWRNSSRFFLQDLKRRGVEQVLFDDYGADGTLAPDGRRLLFTREGAPTYRKRYRGSQASQIWMYDLVEQSFTEMLKDELGYRSPLWQPDGSGFYYVGQQDGSFDLYRRDLALGSSTQLTFFEDDSVLWPAISRDGSVILFRHLFDLYRFYPGEGRPPERIELFNPGEPYRKKLEQRELTAASEAAFTPDGLEIAFVSGGDLWVMDTELREPRQVTNTAQMESEPVFTRDGKSILFISGQTGQSDIWKAERTREDRYWWQNDGFALQRLTEDPERESRLNLGPTGDRVAFVRGAGTLLCMNLRGGEVQEVFSTWNSPEFDWSPDGKWFVYSLSDNDFNSDIWITPADGKGTPFNISMHPDNDGGPAWSTDGRLIAFTGRRTDTETDIYYLWLRAEDEQKDARDRKLEKALEKMEKERQKDEKKKGKGKEQPKEEKQGGPDPEKKPEEGSKTNKEGGQEKEEEKKPEQEKLPEVVIDFEGIHERLHRISIPDSE